MVIKNPKLSQCNHIGHAYGEKAKLGKHAIFNI